MEIIAHRRNTITELIATPNNYGIEVDIRTNNGQLMIHHDPLKKGELFEEWLKNYHHQTLILNVKEEGLEDSLLNLMHKYNISKFFFLDQSFPFLIKYAKRGVHQSAVRFSEYESIETVLSLKGLVDWVWIDCFTKFPLTVFDYDKLVGAEFKLCVVSPELQGLDGNIEIALFKNIFQQNNFIFDAVCTKLPKVWQ